MISLEGKMGDTTKRIDFGDASGVTYDLADWRDRPIEEWPYALQMDFWLTITIFGNLHLVPPREVAKYIDIGEKVDEDLNAMLDFL